jgi:hypothetical protein
MHFSPPESLIRLILVKTHLLDTVGASTVLRTELFAELNRTHKKSLVRQKVQFGTDRFVKSSVHEKVDAPTLFIIILSGSKTE